jgi:hypothetical protein
MRLRFAVAVTGALICAALSTVAAFAHDDPTAPSANAADDERNVRAWTQELRDGPLGPGTTVPSPLLRLAEQRAQTLDRLAQTSPRRALELTLTVQERDRWPATVRGLIEQPADLVGDLRIMHVDWLDHHASQTRLELLDTGGVRHQLLLAAAASGIQSGSRARVSGVALAGSGTVLVSGVSSIASSTRAVPTGLQRTAIILASATGVAAHPYANKVNTASIFFSSSNPQSARAYYAQASYGQVAIVGANGEGTAADVYGPYTTSAPSGFCDSWVMDNLALQAAADLDYSRYDRVVISWNDPNAGCGFGGVASIGSVQFTNLHGAGQLLSISIDMNQAFGSTDFNGLIGSTTLHEYGHNLGVYHAGTIECGTASLIDSSCYDVEYGDPSDVMGGSPDGHLSGVHKEELGWLNGRLQYAPASGFYTLYPYEEGSSNIKVLKVPRSRDPQGNITGYYYLEYRRPQAPLNSFAQYATSYAAGVTVHLAGQNGLCVPLAGCAPDFPGFGGGDDSLLINAHPNGGSAAGYFADAPLLGDEWYSDPGAGVSFQVADLSPTAAVIYVYVSPPQPTIQTLVYPPGAGRVIGGGRLSPGMTTTLIATPNNGYQFSYWREANADPAYPNPFSFAVAGDRLVEAVFEALPTPPVNDNFASATPITAVPSRLSVANANANVEAGETTSCANTAVRRTVWYTYSTPTATVINLDTSATTYYTVLAVFTGSSVGAVTPIAAPSCDNGTSDRAFRAKLSFVAQPNVVYHIQVGAAYGSAGQLFLDVSSGGTANLAGYFASPPTAWSTGQTQQYFITLLNLGATAWPATGPNAVFLTVSFGTSDDTPGQGWTTRQTIALPRDVPPQTSIGLTLNVTAPTQTGSFVLRHRLIQQNVGWFLGASKNAVTVGVNCSIRPNVTMAVTPGGGRLLVTITPGGGGSIRSVLVGSPGAPVNALIDVGSQVGLTNPFTLFVPPGSRQTSFSIRRATPNLATTVPFTVIDDCGSWPTFAGGGPTAF